MLAFAFSGCGRVEFSYVCTKSGVYRQQIDAYIDADLSGTGYTTESASEKITEILMGEGFTVTYKSGNHVRAVKDFSSLAELQADTLGNGLYDYEVTGREDFLFDYSTVGGIIAFDRNSKQGYLLLLSAKYGVQNFSVFALAGMQNVDDVDVSYSVVSARRMKTNADEVTEENGYYRYVWYPEESGNYDVTMELREPRRTVWYALAVFASALTVAGFLIYAKCRERVDEDADIQN
jgi:hypothetical protein